MKAAARLALLAAAAGMLGGVLGGLPGGAGQALAQPAEWWTVPGPSAPPARVIGGHARGCLASAVALPADGPGFLVMRPSRQRMYGHPRLIAFIESLGAETLAAGGAGLLVGDLAQARGGPMRSGHRSHQTGLDVDIWFLPAPPDRLGAGQRETLSAPSFVADGGATVADGLWTASNAALLRAAALRPEVDRIFVNAAIKRALCEGAGGERQWLRKIRPWWGHDGHFHVRLACPADENACEPQEPLPAGDGCDASLDWWFSEEARLALLEPKAPPKPLTLDDLPPACRTVLAAP